MLKDWKRKLPGRRRLEKLRKEIDRLQREVDDLKSQIDLEPGLFERFHRDRTSEAYVAHFANPRPLVTVCVPTYNRATLLVERSLKSILGQTYANLEVIVVGDCCTDDTEERVSAIRDTRLRFRNLEQRGQYPSEKELRWMVAGTTPVNLALEMATGDFVTHLDDDDAYAPDRIERLVAFIREQRADVVWHPFWEESSDVPWVLRECPEFRLGQLTTSSVFYHAWLKKIHWDIHAYRYREPGDWNRFRKFRYLGVRAARYPEPLLWHYRERNQREA